MSDFAQAFSVWLLCEGTFAAGVEQDEYDAFRRRHGFPARSVSSITGVEAQDLLREFYWQPLCCASLPQTWATFLLVEASNLPWGDAAKVAQNALAWHSYYVGHIDGVVGPITIQAMQIASAEALLTAVTAMLGHYATQSPESIQAGLRHRLIKLWEALKV